MSATATAMEVNAEARRILAVSISKLYASRSQRGGLRLHRSLLLSLVMRSARDIYHSSREGEPPLAAAEPTEPGSLSWDQIESSSEPQTPAEPPVEEPGCDQEDQEEEEKEFDGESTEDKENQGPARRSRKRRGKVSAAPDFLPSKRARLEPGEERYAAGQGGCRAGAVESLSALSLNRVIPAF